MTKELDSDQFSSIIMSAMLRTSTSPMMSSSFRQAVMAKRDPGGVVFRSSGSTGTSIELAYSQAVIEGAIRRTKEIFKLTPLADGMRVAICFGYGCFPPAFFYQRALVQGGCDVLPLGSGRNLPTQFKCCWLAQTPPHCLIGMPSYILRIGRLLKSQKLLNGVKRYLIFIVVGGEPLGQARKRALEDIFNVPVFDHYGMLEAPMIAGSCCHEKMHVSNEYICEVLSDKEIKESGYGELLLSSSIVWPGIKLLRLRTGDEVLLSRDPCECGRNVPTLKVLGRLGDERKVNGIRISLSELHRSLIEVPVYDYYLEVVNDHGDNEQATLYVDTEASRGDILRLIRNLIPAKIDVKMEKNLDVPMGTTGKPLRFLKKIPRHCE